MKNFLSRVKAYIFKHKVISSVVLVVVLLLGYWGYSRATNTSGVTRYVTAAVTRGTIVSSVTGSGQVSAVSQIDLTPKVSGAIIGIAVQSGDMVKGGQLLFSIDSTTARKAVRDAEVNLQSAQLALQKLQIQNSSENLNSSLAKDYSDGFDTVSSVFLDLPSTITGIQNLLNQQNLSDNAARNSGNTGVNYRNTAEAAYYAANAAYEKNKNDFASLNYSSKQSDIDAIISETYNTTELLATAIKDLNDYVNYLVESTNRPSDFTSFQTTLSGYTTTINGHSSALLSAQSTIKNSQDSIPTNNIDLQNAQISVTQKQNALSDAQQTLADYYIRAPFDGIIASVPVQKGDNASSGTVLGTIITSQQMATIPFNEVDIAKIQLGQKATMTFDAIPNLTITGKVAQIDSVGTVSQGVVNYNVKISFDTSDQRIKPGMTANASIITGMTQDILTVPNSAVKTQNGTTYVEIFDTPLPAPTAGTQGSPSNNPPGQQAVTIGISDDTSTEIISGLNEGDQVVVRTIAGTSSTTSTPSIFSAVGGNRNPAGGTGNAGRILRGN